MIAALTIVAVAILSLIFSFKPKWGLAAVIFLLPFERIGSFALNSATGYPVIRLVQVAGSALVISLAIRILMRQQRLRYLPPMKWLGMLSLWALIPVLSLNYGPLYRDYISAVFVMSLFVTITQLVTLRNLTWIIKSAIASLVAVSLFGIWQLIGDLAGWSATLTGLQPLYSKVIYGIPRIHSVAAEPLFFANFLLVPLLVLLSILVSRQGGRSRWLYGLFALIGLNYILTLSRGGYVAVGFGVVIVVLLVKRHFKLAINWRMLAAIAGLIVVIFGTTSALASYQRTKSISYGLRLFATESTAKLFSSNSYRERRAALSQAVASIEQAPLAGIGIGGFGYKLKHYPKERSAGDRVAINNQFLEVAVETGLVGLLFYLGFIGSILRLGWRSLKTKANVQPRIYLVGLLAGICSVLIQLLSFSGFYISYIWVNLGLLAGLAWQLDLPRPKIKPAKDGVE